MARQQSDNRYFTKQTRSILFLPMKQQKFCCDGVQLEHKGRHIINMVNSETNVSGILVTMSMECPNLITWYPCKLCINKIWNLKANEERMTQITVQVFTRRGGSSQRPLHVRDMTLPVLILHPIFFRVDPMGVACK